MSAITAICVVCGYFALLVLISHFTSKNADSETFFIANKQSPWFLVAFGMVGASLSGITFISVPGDVAASNFTYFQLVIGYLIGIAVIAVVLLPLYYRLNLYSIYEYLGLRFGYWSHKTGAGFFLIAQTMYAAFKLYLMATVLQIAIFESFGLPFAVTVLCILTVIWLYTFRSGIKTVLYTDVFQTTFLLLSVVASIYAISQELHLSFTAFIHELASNSHAQTFVWDWHSKNNFFKLVTIGALLTIVTNGLDQSVMQKHLTCRSLRESWKNMFSFSVMLLLSNCLFLSLGLLLVMYANAAGIAIPEKTDDLYPLLALDHLGGWIGVFFLLGITSAAFSSADSALTGLTTSFCVDFLGRKKNEPSDSHFVRHCVHVSISLILFFVLIVFHQIQNTNMIRAFVTFSGFTYGPLLGLYAFGLFTRYKITDAYTPWICIASPLASYALKIFSQQLFWGYQIEYEVLLINGAITFACLWLFRVKGEYCEMGALAAEAKGEST
ncbi:sodium:solute symporter [bacterium]|nr:sodium:solute symporter [bacterium]